MSLLGTAAAFLVGAALVVLLFILAFLVALGVTAGALGIWGFLEDHQLDTAAIILAGMALVVAILYASTRTVCIHTGWCA